MSIATTPKANNPVSELSKFLGSMKTQLAMALPKHLNADRMTRLVLTEFSKSRDLQACSFNSIAGSIMTASQLGLEIGVGGQAYLIPYKGTCTFVPGWKGLIELLNRAGRATAWTGAVFEGDFFEWELGDSPFCKHKPAGENDPYKLVAVYAVGRVNGAEWPIIECWTNERVRKHFEKNNKVGSKHYAHGNWEMYARKVVLLQVLKYLPKSIELQNAITIADAVEMDKKAVIDGNFVTIEESDEDQVGSPSKPRTVDDLTSKSKSEPKNEPDPARTIRTLEEYKSRLSGCKNAADIEAVRKLRPTEIEATAAKLWDVAELEREDQLGLLK